MLHRTLKEGEGSEEETGGSAKVIVESTCTDFSRIKVGKLCASLSPCDCVISFKILNAGDGTV